MTLPEKLYELTQKRGVIPKIPLGQLNYKFLDKLQEELNELIVAYYKTGIIDKLELADCFIVICNIAQANSIDIEISAITKAVSDVKRQKQ